MTMSAGSSKRKRCASRKLRRPVGSPTRMRSPSHKLRWSGGSPKGAHPSSCKVSRPLGGSDLVPIRLLVGSMMMQCWIRSRLYLLDNERGRLCSSGGARRREREGPGSRTPGGDGAALRRTTWLRAF